MNHLIDDAAQRASRYLDGLAGRSVTPSAGALEGLKRMDIPLQEQPMAPETVLAELDEMGSPATVSTAGGRFYGFVIGGTLPAALAANLLAGAWDQNGAYQALSPVAAALEKISAGWMLDLLGLPGGCGVGIVTGATMANFTCLAAARHHLLAQAGWNVEDDGLFDAPPLTVIVGGEVHVSLLKALSLLGLGRQRVVRVAVDDQGRMRADGLPKIDGPTILCLQAGNVNSGSFDPAREIIPMAKAAGAWVHVDGAFGLWALASPALAHLAEGFEAADSWAADAHKWLNVPYDSGIALVRDALALRASMSTSAAYLITGGGREPCHYTPELSRRGRGIEIWAALRSLGRRGLAEMLERSCAYARQFAQGLQAAGYEVLNDVVLNQALVSFGEPEVTRAVIRRIQAQGVCWCGGTEWQGRTAMRISISGWATTEADVAVSLEAVLKAAGEERGASLR